MAAIDYAVAAANDGTIRITGRPSGFCGPLRLSVQPAYGPLTGLDGRFIDWTYGEEDNAPARTVSLSAAGELTLPAGTQKFSYTVRLEARESHPEALFCGYEAPDFRFFLGLALFAAARIPAAYRVSFDRRTVSSRGRPGRTFQFRDRRDLFLAAFAQKNVFVRRPENSRAVLAGPGKDREMAEELGTTLSAVLQDAAGWFGGPQPFRRLSVFLWTGAEQPGGVSIRGACWAALPAGGGASFSRWLLLHEMLHQWIGVAVRPAHPGLDWFFEGMVGYLANLFLLRRSLITADEIAAAVGHDSERARSDPASFGINRFHELCGKFGEDPARLAAWSADLFRRRRGKTVSAADLESYFPAGPQSLTASGNAIAQRLLAMASRF